MFWGGSDEHAATADDIALPSRRLVDTHEAASWIIGTELEKELRGSANTGRTMLVRLPLMN